VTRKHDERPAAEVAARDETLIGHDVPEPDIHEPLTDSATAEDLAALAARMRQQAADGREFAEAERARCQAHMAAVREKTMAMIADAEAEVREPGNVADRREHEAHDLAERAGRVDNAAAIAAKVEASEARVRALEDERDELSAKQGGLSAHVAELLAQTREIEPQLAAALEAGDLELIASLRATLDSIAALVRDRREQQAPILARLDALGDGEMSPIWPQKELAEARRVVNRIEVRRALNHAQPDRPEAVADAKRDYEQLMDRMTSDRLATERAERARQPRQQIVHL
jgi:hypothetical protein